MVITDDRIETIVDAIVEGRAMWASVRDALSILLGGNLGEIGDTVITGLISPREGINVRQLLLVNVLTDVLPAMAIAVRLPPTITAEVLLAVQTPGVSTFFGFTPLWPHGWGIALGAASTATLASIVIP